MILCHSNADFVCFRKLFLLDTLGIRVCITAALLRCLVLTVDDSFFACGVLDLVLDLISSNRSNA